jgi:hypothetical protein
VVATFLALSLTSALMVHLDTVGIVTVAGLAGVLDARAWYGLTAAAVRRSAERPPHPWHWRATLQRMQRSLLDRTSWVPVAPLAAVLVLALVVGMARLAFTGTVHFSHGASEIVETAGGAAGLIASAGSGAGGGQSKTVSTARARGAVLVVEGFGSNCCNAANNLRAAEPGMLVRQFSYLGLNAAGQPVPYNSGVGDLTIQQLGDRMATQVEQLYQQAGVPVDVVAESEGTLGLYAMLARHPHVPVKSVTLLSPIIQPGQLGQAGGTVPRGALTTLNNLVGGMSPYGSSGAQALINSVSEVGGRYFEQVSHERALPWLAVIPLADAVTLSACPWPQNVVFVDAFHGGLLGNPSVRQLVESFLSDGTTPVNSASQRQLRSTAQLIAAAATAWRIPDLGTSCPAPKS